MKQTWIASIASVLLLSLPGGAAHAQSSPEHTENGVPISHLLATVAKKTGKKFVVDPFANVQRIQAIIETLDVGEPYTPGKCSPYEAWMSPGGANSPPALREPSVEHR